MRARWGMTCVWDLSRPEKNRLGRARRQTLCAALCCSFQFIRDEPEMHISPWGKPFSTPTVLSEVSSTYGLIPACTRVFIRQLNLSSPTTRTRLPFHSWPAQMIQRPHQRAFFTLKEPQPTSSVTRGLIIPHSMKTKSDCRTTTATPRRPCRLLTLPHRQVEFCICRSLTTANLKSPSSSVAATATVRATDG